MSNGVIIHASQFSRVNGGTHILKDGSPVLVRIIADKGNGKYTGSVAGVRVNISSAKKIDVGSTFIATISSKNGIISITPKNPQIILNNNIEITQADNSKIYAFLEALGLNADDLYVNLLQQFTQQEMKIDNQLMAKLHNLAIKFKGKEKNALELLSILANKGVPFDEDSLLQLINLLFAEELDFNEKNDFDDGKELLNKINRTPNGWFILPFELCNLKDENVLGFGNVRLLMDKGNQLKVMNLECQYNQKKYLFNTLFEAKKCNTIRFNVNPMEIDKVDNQLKKMKKLFMNYSNKVKIEWAEAFEIEGTAAACEELYGVGGEV